MNKVVLIGNVCRDIEVYTTQGGVKKVSYSLAVRRRFANQQGEHETDFISCQSWRNTAEYCEKNLAKGKKVAVVGELRTNNYTTQDGQKRFRTYVEVEELNVLPSGSTGGNVQNDEVPAPTGEMVQNEDDELPF